MAGNSADDPVIVNSWEECLTALRNYTKYIKFADSDDNTIDTISITSAINCNCTQVDFNGWTINTINVSNINDYYVFRNGSFWGITTAKNVTINHINFYKSCKGNIRFIYYLMNCYLYDVWYESHDTTYTDRYDNAFDFGLGTFALCNIAYMSIIYMRSQDYAPRIPTLNARNCEIHIDYKWTKTGAGNNSLLFGINHGNSSPYDVGTYYCCYITGTIDLSEGSGEWQWTSPESAYVGVLKLISTIFNIQVLTGANCTFDRIKIQPDANAAGKGSLFVTNNGNSESRFNQVLNVSGIVYKASKADLANTTFLTNKSFDYIADDNYRYSQYNSASYQDKWTWRQESHLNGGIPFLPFFSYPVYVPPVIYPIERADRISVYDIYEPQTGFDHNGVAVLYPSEVISYKEDMGRWDINLTHPIDQYGKWTYIIGQNCIKVNGQIFRIDETEIYCDANQQYIKAHANHISYDLNDAFIGDATFEVMTGNAFEYEIIQASKTLIPTQEPTPYEYTFELTSDITGQLVGDFHDQTVTGALYGDDNSFANRYGGHLYRDNFHLSINTVQENLPAAPAFQIRYGTDMTKISYKIDFSSWITELICEDNYGDLWGIAYTGSEWIIHHNKTKRIHFTYPPETPDPMACLETDGFNYWQTVNTPKVSIEVSVANIKSDPKYKDFLNLQNMDVGYTGTVYFEQMGIDVDLKIVSIKRNELTGEAIQITLGNAPNSFIRSPVCSQTIVPNGSVEAKQAQTIKDMQTEIENVKLKSMKYWNGMKNYTWADVKKYKWEEIKNGELNN